VEAAHAVTRVAIAVPSGPYEPADGGFFPVGTLRLEKRVARPYAEKIGGSVGTSPVISSAKGREIRGRPARLCVGDDMAVKDPICAMVIEESDAVGSSEYNGTTYYFCSMDCKEEFDENPGDYAD